MLRTPRVSLHVMWAMRRPPLARRLPKNPGGEAATLDEGQVRDPRFFKAAREPPEFS